MEWLNKMNYEAMIWFIYVYVLIKNNNIFLHSSNLRAKKCLYIIRKC